LYTHADPVNGIDPSGNMSMAVSIGIGVAIGVGLGGIAIGGYYGALFLHQAVAKPMSRSMWEAVINSYLRPRGYEAAAFCMEYSLQDKPPALVLAKTHFISQKVLNSSEYKELKAQLAQEYAPGTNFSDIKKTIDFKERDLFLAIHLASIRLSGQVDPNGNVVITNAVLNDKYDFTFLPGYYGKKYGYGDYGYKQRFFGFAALAANNMAWSDQFFGVIVPYDITIHIE
jgi:hypothetical protein